MYLRLKRACLSCFERPTVEQPVLAEGHNVVDHVSEFAGCCSGMGRRGPTVSGYVQLGDCLLGIQQTTGLRNRKAFI